MRGCDNKISNAEALTIDDKEEHHSTESDKQNDLCILLEMFIENQSINTDSYIGFDSRKILKKAQKICTSSYQRFNNLICPDIL